jgi:hypothetical protein
LSEFLDDLERQKFELLLAKVVRQRPEHLASALKRHPHCYGYIFVHCHKFNSIPRHWREVVFQIARCGPRVDRSSLGTWVCTLHAFGKEHGQFDKSKVRYMAGCKFHVSIVDGIVVDEVNSNVKPFLWLLQTAKPYDRRHREDEALPKTKSKTRSLTSGFDSYSVV